MAFLVIVQSIQMPVALAVNDVNAVESVEQEPESTEKDVGTEKVQEDKKDIRKVEAIKNTPLCI